MLICLTSSFPAQGGQQLFVVLHRSFQAYDFPEPRPRPLLAKRWPLREFKKFESSETVLRIRDVYPGSQIRIFTVPGSRIQDQKDSW